jgi:hypothetical protein
MNVIVGSRAESLRRAVGIYKRRGHTVCCWWSCLSTSDSVTGEKGESCVEKGGGLTEWVRKM